MKIEKLKEEEYYLYVTEDMINKINEIIDYINNKEE